MTSSTPDDRDPVMAELRYLANETALITKLEACTATLALLPESLIASSEPAYRQARVLHAVLMQVADRAHASLRADDRDATAGMVLAAGAVLGLVTEPPGNHEVKPSEMTRKPATGSKEVRQELAAEWLVPPLSSARAFRGKQAESLDAFRHALLDCLEDEQSLRLLAQRLGISPMLAAPVFTETAVESGPVQRVSWLAVHRRLVIAVVAVLATVGLGLGLGLSLTSSPSPAAANGSRQTGNSGASSGSGRTTIGLPPGHKTEPEQEGHVGEKWTYTNPFNPVDTGPAVLPLQKVRVSCKVYAPSFASVSPDGYWYRLASPPYDNRDYGIANSYLNGNPAVGTSNVPQINTDFKVPDCPR